MNDAQKAAVDATIAKWKGVRNAIEQEGLSTTTCPLCKGWPGRQCKDCIGNTPTTIVSITKEDIVIENIHRLDGQHDLCDLGVEIRTYLGLIRDAITKALVELKAIKEMSNGEDITTPS